MMMMMMVDEQLAWKWLAPEAMREHLLRPLSDVWSFGVFLIELLQYGEEPYPGLCLLFTNTVSKVKLVHI